MRSGDNSWRAMLVVSGYLPGSEVDHLYFGDAP